MQVAPPGIRRAELAQHRLAGAARGSTCSSSNSMLRLSGLAGRTRCRRDLEPMLATAAKAARRRRMGATSSSGTGSGRSPSSRTARLRISARRGDRRHRPLPGAGGDRRRARRPRGDPRRRGRRLRRGRAAELPAPAAADGTHRPRRRSGPRAETPVTYVAFDLLWLDGRSLLAEPYERRRELLAELGFDGPNWQTPRHHVGDGAALLGSSGSAASRGSSRSGSAPLPARPPQPRLAQGPQPPRPGARDRRLDAGRGQRAAGGSARCSSATGTRPPRRPSASDARSGSSTPVGVGTGFTQAMLDRADRAARRRCGRERARSSSARTRGSSTRSGPATAAPARSGSSPSSSARSSSPSGRARARSAPAAFKGLRDDKDPREVVREG